MSESKHTPGPWEWQQMGDWKLVGQHGMRPIVLDVTGVRKSSGPPPAGVFRVRDAAFDRMIAFDPNHPDARLLKAAPDLFAALKELLDSPASFSDERIDYEERQVLKGAWKAAHAAIAKAEGR